MPIDFSEYVYLVPFDVSPTSIYLDSIDYARLALPEFDARQGTPEDAILQAVSYISALNIAAINRLPDRLMAGLVGMMGVEINDGEKAVIDVTFTCIDYDGTTVPQGTVVRYEYDFLGEQRSVFFETIEEGEILPIVFTGSEELPTVTVEAECIDVGEILPLSSGDSLTIETPTSQIVAAEVNTMVSRGKNPETTDEFLTRATRFLGSLSSAFAKAFQIDGFVLSTYASTVSRCKTFDLTNAASDLEWGDPDEPGYVTVFVYGINQLATTSEKIDILAGIQERTVAGLEIGVLDVNIVDLEIEVNAGYSSDYDAEVVEQNIATVIANYFSPNNYRFAEGIKLSEFYAIVSAIPGILYVNSVVVTTGAGASLDVDGNVEFTLKGSLPRISTDDIVVGLTSVDE